MVVDGEWVESKKERLGARERAVRTQVSTFAERDESCGAWSEVTPRIAIRKGRHREIRQEVDALKAGTTERVAVSALVQGAEWWSRSRHHVRDARPASHHGRREAEGFVVGVFADGVGEVGDRPVAGVYLPTFD